MMKIGSFSPITLSDYPTLKPFFNDQSFPLCAYSLSSLIVWSTKLFQPYSAVIDGDALAIALEYNAIYEQNRHLILPVSPEGRTFPPEELKSLAQKLGFTSFWFVTKEYIEDFKEERIGKIFAIESQSQLEDYVYLREDLAQLKGNRYAKKRNLIRQFEREYTLRNRAAVEPITADSAQACIDFVEEWCRQRNCDVDPDEDLACEKIAAINSIRWIEEMEMRGILIRIDGKVCAIGISSQLKADTGVFHFEKAFTQYKGLYQYLDRECARRLFDGCIYINKESDMDIPELEKAKRSYHPVEIVPCFKLTLLE